MKQLVTFFALAYLISWIVWFPLYAHVFGLRGLPTFPVHHALGGLGPAAAAFATAWIYRGKTGVIQLLRGCLKVKPLAYLLVALLGPFAISLIAMLVSWFTNKTPIFLAGLLTTREFSNANFFLIFGYNLVFFGFGEETGWRGFALPRFQEKFNAKTSSLLLTIFWALWHLPLFFYRPGYTSMDFAGMVGWMFSLLTGSVLLTWLFNSTRGSIFICAVFHSTIDIAFTSDVAEKTTVGYMGALITIWGILTLLLFRPKNLAKVERVREAVS